MHGRGNPFHCAEQIIKIISASMHSEVADSNRSRSRLDDVVSIEIFLAQGTAIGDRDGQSIGVRAVVERMGIAQHELVRPVVIGMPQRVTCLQ